MPIYGIKQPETIEIDDKIRLRKFYGAFEFALPWYLDKETVYLVDGNRRKYTLKRLCKMYQFLDKSGELYFIEYRFGNSHIPIGDVTFSREDLPIVIGEPICRGSGIGKKVLLALIERAKELDLDALYVKEIYDYNIGSRKCFESVGFTAYEKTEKGSRYMLNLK